MIDNKNIKIFPYFSCPSFLVCKTTNQKATNSDENGDIYVVPDQNKECVFPFTFEGETFNKCTNFGCPECFWCGTQYDVSDNIGWGICNEACPTQEYIPPDSSGTVPILAPIPSSSQSTSRTSTIQTTKPTTISTSTTSNPITPASIIAKDVSVSAEDATTTKIDVDSLIGNFNIDIRRR